MGTEETLLKRKFFYALDLFLMVCTFVIAAMIHVEDGTLTFVSQFPGPFQQLVLALLLMTSAVTYQMFRLYEPDRQLERFRTSVSIIKAVVSSVSAVLLVLYLAHSGDVSRVLIGSFVVLNIVALLSYRYVRLLMHRRSVKQGLNTHEVLIIGSRERAKDLIRYLKAMTHLGYRILGCLEVDDSNYDEEVAEGVRVIGSLENFRSFLLHFAVDEIVFAMPLSKIDDVMDYIGFAEELGINVRILPDWQIHSLKYKPSVAALTISDFVGMPMMSLSSGPQRVFELTVKGIFDRCAAGIGLVFLSPLFILLAAAIKLSSSGPVFFRQERSGLNGRTFGLYKFRSMVTNAEELRKGLESQNEQEGPVFKITDDPRVTGIGKFLRKTSLDELPQLINVVKGEMSLVGPRPPLPSEVVQYDPWQRRRLSMKPGITCIWQVSGRNNIGFEQWMRMDLAYIDKWSLLLDIKLLLKTFPAVVFGTGR